MRQYTSFWATLAATPLFQGLPEARVRALVGEEAMPRPFLRGEVLFGPADRAQALAFLLAGSALVHKTGGDGRRMLMSRLTPGDIFGMASLFHEETFPTEVRAETAGSVLFLKKAWLETAFSQEPLLPRNYIALLSERIHFLNRRIEAFTGDDAPARLLRVLSGLTTDPEGKMLVIPYSLSQLAMMLGIGRASLYRAFDALEAAGVLSREGRRVTMRRPEAPPHGRKTLIGAKAAE